MAGHEKKGGFSIELKNIIFPQKEFVLIQFVGELVRRSVRENASKQPAGEGTSRAGASALAMYMYLMSLCEL